MSEDDVDNSRAPLIEHLIELRQRLFKSVIGLTLMFILSFIFATDIFNILTVPYEKAAGDLKDIEFIYTAPQEYFFTQLKLSFFGALFLSFPVLA
ncbi:MAG: twin-arginine translocase subunit TatC, partial [Hyphomicrobiales bacterium]